MTAHIASGTLVMSEDEVFSLQVGSLSVRFAKEGVAPGVCDFSVVVPFGKPPSITSTSNLTLALEAGSYRLRVVFVGAGARGEVQQISYTLSLAG